MSYGRPNNRGVFVGRVEGVGDCVVLPREVGLVLPELVDGRLAREEEAVAHAVGRRGIEGERGGRAARAQSRPVARVLEKAKDSF